MENNSRWRSGECSQKILYFYPGFPAALFEGKWRRIGNVLL